MIGVVYGSGKESEVDSNGHSEGWTTTPPLSTEWWFSIYAIDKTTILFLRGKVSNLKWTADLWLFYSLGGSVGSLPGSALNCFVIIRLGGKKIGTLMMQAYELCLILPHS